MTKTIALFFFLGLNALINAGLTTPSQNLSFTLNSNLIINPNISTPVISPYAVVQYSLSQAGWSTLGQQVKYVDICLAQQNGRISCTPQGITCGWQFLDTDSLYQNEQYFQDFVMPAGNEYQLTIDWISENPPVLLMLLTSSTGFKVTWNGALVYSTYDISCSLITSTFYLISVAGTNELVIGGLGYVDGYGILIRNIQLRQLVYPSSAPTDPANTTNPTSSNTTINNATITSNATSINNTTNTTDSNSLTDSYSFDDLQLEINGTQYQSVFRVINFIQDFQYSKAANSVFASKQNVRFLLGFILQFNHFLLYNYHILNMTVMSNVILAGMQTLDDQKGQLLDDYVYPFINTSPSAIMEGFQMQNDLPANIANVVSKYNQRPDGMLTLIMDTLWLDVPITLSIFSVGLILFKLLFKFRISVLFRQYSILGCLIYVLLDGKVQIATFNFLSQALLLKYANFALKMKTVSIIFYYFIIFTLSASSMLFMKAVYSKLLKYIYQNCKNYSSSGMHMCMNFGIYNIVLGFAHRILLTTPLLQLYTLITIETIYLVYLLSFLLHGRFENIFLGATLCAMNCVRLAFVVTFLAFEYRPDLQYEISVAQQNLFFTFIFLWILSSFLCLAEKINIIYKTLVFQCKKQNKISPLSTQTKVKSNDNHLKLMIKPPKKKGVQFDKSFKGTSYPPSIHIFNADQEEIKIDLKSRIKSNVSIKYQIAFEEEQKSRNLVSTRMARKKRPNATSNQLTLHYQHQ